MKKIIIIHLLILLSTCLLAQSRKELLKQNDFINSAIDAFNNEDYKEALYYFEEILKISDKYKQLDTVIIFNAGLAAYNAEDYNKAINYWDRAAKTGYNEARTYSLIANAYQLKKDTLAAINILQEGFRKYPEDNTVLTSMIQLYLDMNKIEEALKYLNLAIEREPTNATYSFAKGTLFEKMGNTGMAIEAYEKAISCDNEFYNAYYNLGALFYNQFIERYDKALNIKEEEVLNEEMKKAFDFLFLALPHLERCASIEPKNDELLEILRKAFLRLAQEDSRYETYVKELNDRTEKLAVYYTPYEPHSLFKVQEKNPKLMDYEIRTTADSHHTIIKMKSQGGVNYIPCKVNGLNMEFIFDTGASNVCISLAEAYFMLKNDYLEENDIIGTSYAQIANGDVVENSEILIKRLEIGGITLFNVKASIIHNLDAPLLLGNSAIQKLGKIQIDGSNLIILN